MRGELLWDLLCSSPPLGVPLYGGRGRPYPSTKQGGTKGEGAWPWPLAWPASP
jgi:hypothetical protein